MEDKKKLFERMGSIGEMPINKIINEAHVPNSTPMIQILNILDREGYFPLWSPTGIKFVDTEEFPQEYEKFRNMFNQAWSKISLPY